MIITLVVAGTSPAQNDSSSSSSSSANQTQQNSQQPQAAPQTQQQTPPEAGGPQGEVSPVVVPKKTATPPPPPPKPKVVNPPGMPSNYTLHVNVPLVDVPVLVTTKNGEFIPGLKEDNFKILEDGTQQKIASFKQSADAPITAVLLVEFANKNYQGYPLYGFIEDMLQNAYGFAQTLKPNDWVAVVSYDMKPEIQQDFTQNKQAVQEALFHLRIPGFSETNLFDALYDTLDRLDRIQGHKYVILISSGVDTFSKLNFDQILKKVKATKDTTIFSISTGFAVREALDAAGAIDPGNVMPGTTDRMDYAQADNEMRTFASLTGGRSYFPRFAGDVGGIMQDIANCIRNEYILSYYPSNSKQDGTYRKIKIDLQAPDGGPLDVHVNGKRAKYNIVARQGYTAKREVE